MTGGGDVAFGAVWVVDGVHAGDDGMPQSRGDLVQVPENLGGVEVEVGEGTGGGTQAAHGGGSADAAAHDVAHNECGLVAIERQDVVPVAADLECGLCGPVPGGDLQAGTSGREFREEAALQGLGGVAHPLVRAGVVDAHGGARGQLTGEGEVVLVEGQRVARPGETQEAQGLAVRGERDCDVGVHA